MNWWKILIKYKVHHIFLWGILFAGWYFFRANEFRTPALALKITFVKVAILASLTYFTNYLLIPRLLYKKKYWQFFTVYLMVIIGMGLVKLAIIVDLLFPGAAPYADFKSRFYDNIIPLFLLVTTGAACRLIKDYLQSQRRLNEIAKEKAETELKFLKSQINPHFLFNSLNSIYFLIDKNNTEARQTLLQFSDLLRYQLYDCNSETIEIEKEVEYLKDYIRLQQLRKDKNYEVKVKLDNELKGFQIVPLILIPFVENAFKHISHYSKQMNFIHVELGRTNGQLNFSVENSKDDHQRSTDPHGGIGLNNVKRRLELLYPGQHELEIHNNDTTFKVELNIEVKN